jgi:putative zinc finger/helix-turn-helix YgiT family protein
MSRAKKEVVATCEDCDGRLQRRTESHRLPLVGEWGVTLEDVEIVYCDRCGARGVSIERMAPLMQEIATAVIGKKMRLVAAEVTFLRKHLGYTAARLGKVLGVTGPTVLQWESGREQIGPSADRLLRALVLIRDGLANRFDASRFETIEDGSAQLRLTVRRDSQGNWAAAAK